MVIWKNFDNTATVGMQAGLKNDESNGLTDQLQNTAATEVLHFSSDISVKWGSENKMECN